MRRMTYVTASIHSFVIKYSWHLRNLVLSSAFVKMSPIMSSVRTRNISTLLRSPEARGFG